MSTVLDTGDDGLAALVMCAITVAAVAGFSRFHHQIARAVFMVGGLLIALSERIDRADLTGGGDAMSDTNNTAAASFLPLPATRGGDGQ